MSIHLTAAIGELQALQDKITNILGVDSNIDVESNAALVRINKQVQDASAQLYMYVNNSNLNVNETITKAIEAEVFIREAKELLNEIYKDDEERLKNMKVSESTQLKQIQFNNYFSQKYNYNVGIMKVLVFTSILLMICIILHTRSLIPDSIYTILLSIIISIALIVIVIMLISEARRSNTDFSNYQWYFNQNNAPNNAS